MNGKFKRLLLFSFVVILCENSEGGATIEQMMSTIRLMRDVCQPKFKVPDEVADELKRGQMPDGTNVKCYVNCLLEMSQLVRKGKIQEEVIKKQIELMVPDELKPQYKRGVHQCKDSANGIKNACEVSYVLLKCIFKEVPDFIFP